MRVLYTFRKTLVSIHLFLVEEEYDFWARHVMFLWEYQFSKSLEHPITFWWSSSKIGKLISKFNNPLIAADMNIIFHVHPFSYPSNPVCIEIRIKGCWVKKKETSSQFECSPALVRMCCPCASTHTRSSAPSTAPSWSPSGLVLRSMDHVQNRPILSTQKKHEETIKSLDICVTVPLPSNCDKHCGCKGIKNGLSINIHYITVLICFEWSLNISGEGFSTASSFPSLG